MATDYESQRVLNEYLLFHYGSQADVLGDFPVPAEGWGFPVRTAEMALAHGACGRALDLGCSVGRSAFELARGCDEVVGIDCSEVFVDAADLIAREGQVPYDVVVEGEHARSASARVPEGVDPGRVRFERGDAMALRDNLGSFDCVHAANLICRLPDPQRLLKRLPELVVDDGVLVLATPFTWLEEFTPRGKWLGPDGFGALEKLLEPSFELLKAKDEPMLIRETARKYQFTFSKVSVWRRVAG
ncbi:putative 4-mercaptohistidine N1-methyltransferase [Sulfuriroseicoccus oceanibius]|uniref:Putative 4-mercaptohistidine N1-methyltransferase n=1 Tax=Sulfuriroseicoccus oceanibius TaxID=2707525 RepID=A0A6B3LFH9_9BACT|nr:putative 4-mercaptohistidine N1-methyltransferase [Sulfuriroseicoccus oceanibius]QQL45651.1 putative 4-mercaptohistidine N1-methyltransferase [Sulfuriroseicoccus oceanibius]